MKQSKLLILCSVIFLASAMNAQKIVDLKLNFDKTSGSSSCFDIQLRSPDGLDIDLAGQNYRIFYNAGNLKFLKDRITNNLDKKAYSQIDLIHTENNDIGFVSLSIDSKILSDKGVSLPRSGDWMNTVNICFERNTDQNFDLTWANQRKTSLFATAEVALSEWITPENQQVLIPNELYDFSSIDANVTTESINISVYPNPVADYINVSFELPQSGELVIKDIIGRQVVTDQLDLDQQLRYNLDGWPEGSYTVMVLDKKGSLLDSRNIVKVLR